MRNAPKGGQNKGDITSHFKFMKSKEQIQTLTLTLVGATVHLSTQGKSKGYFIERILKKTNKECKSFFKELGLHEEPTKRRNRETNEDIDDMFVYFPYGAAAAAIKRERQENAAQEAYAEDGEAAEQNNEYGNEYG